MQLTALHLKLYDKDESRGGRLHRKNRKEKTSVVRISKLHEKPQPRKLLRRTPA